MIAKIKLLVLFAALSALLMMIGYSLGGKSGLVFSLFFSLITQGIAFWNSDKIALAMNGAKEIKQDEYPWLFEMTQNLSQAAELPMPRLFIVPELSPNAFATGRDPEHSCVAVTNGLLANLQKDEIEAVLAHELGHIKNRDVFISTVAAVIAGTISSLTHFAFLYGGSSRDREGNAAGAIFSIILAPFLAMLIQLMISRSREYQADASAAKFTGKPENLARALRKIEELAKGQFSGQLQPAFSSLYIANPFAGAGFLTELFSTHPRIEKRIEKLMSSARLD